MLPLSGLAIIAYMTAFIFAPPVDIDGIREPVDKRKAIMPPQILIGCNARILVFFNAYFIPT